VRSNDLQQTVDALRACKVAQNLHKEVKWTRITERYENKYKALLDVFFDLTKAGKIKVRIMFTQNTMVPQSLTKRHVDEKYFILYYQFLKHAFGLRKRSVSRSGIGAKFSRQSQS
jgi:hypothetical protein